MTTFFLLFKQKICQEYLFYIIRVYSYGYCFFVVNNRKKIPVAEKDMCLKEHTQGKNVGKISPQNCCVVGHSSCLFLEKSVQKEKKKFCREEPKSSGGV